MSDEWQPIETAPRDGRFIDGFNAHNGERHVSRWDEKHRGANYTNWWPWDGNWGNEPTHWKPLPDWKPMPKPQETKSRNDWRPMQTAEKEVGKPVLLAVVTRFGRKATQAEWTGVDWLTAKGWRFNHDNPWVLAWMPLPDPPEE
jgi:hypothetical protein